MAFVFPGQGSQAVGMLDAWGAHPVVLQTLQEASDALAQDVGRLIFGGPKEALDLTTNTQPVMLVAALACYRVWMSETGLSPVVMAGHSLGEYTALVAAGALSLTQALPLVRFRAQAMQEAVPVGAGGMAAILGLSAELIVEVCARVSAQGDIVEAANFNDPKQTVIAGTRAGVDRACEQLKGLGAKRTLLLPVSAPFHSSLMKPAADHLKTPLLEAQWAQPSIEIINNVDVKVEADSAAICDALYRQAFSPVRWLETIQAMAARGITHIVECGPGKVLAGMTKRIVPERAAGGFYDPGTLAEVHALVA